MKKLLALVSVTFVLHAQAPSPAQPILNNQQALALYARSAQLIESTMFAVPELQRLATALLENARQGASNLRVNAGNALLTYNFLSNLRAYLALSDAVPKPFPFPEEGQKQFTELRD